MTTLLRVDASIRVEGSVSRALADSAQAAWQAEHPNGTVIRRDLGLNPIPADTWPLAVAATMGMLTEDQLGPEHVAATALARELSDELRAADAVVLAIPLYNYGISQHVKAWIDMLLTDRELSSDSGPLVGKPIIFTLARGGGYSPGTPREGWDHATPYLERIFGDVFGMKIRTAVAELTLAAVTPGMETLIEAAKESTEAAHVTAEGHAADVARQLADAA
ncbi:MAG: FMN-dependent NADH-azoreductase [Kribbellaceae bacterium]|jgi:FMN-dependent NADH-azoreductase|nr:FMN-dependent NADH-azoreductase [Kribbellaceae bacterium]